MLNGWEVRFVDDNPFSPFWLIDSETFGFLIDFIAIGEIILPQKTKIAPNFFLDGGM